jgi:hypothetical protein
MKIENQDIYEQIGNLFYAVATDQLVTRLEVAELKALIGKYWLPGNKDAVISDETHWILVTIDGLEGENVSPKDAYDQFCSFYRLNAELFAPEVRQRILDTCLEIVDVFDHKMGGQAARMNELKTLMRFDEASVVK